MKIQIELNPELAEEEIVIRCPGLSDKISRMQQALSEIDSHSQKNHFVSEGNGILLGFG